MARRRRKDSSPNPTVLVILLLAGLSVGIQQQQWGIVWLLVAVLLICTAIGLLVLLIRMRRNDRLRRSNIAEIDTMTGVQFERYIRLKLIELGYKKVRLTTSYDLGIDIIAHKDGEVWGIQVKRYTKPVGLDAVRQASTALNHYGCTKAMVITNSYFTPNARAIAASVGCELIDRDRLISLLART